MMILQSRNYDQDDDSNYDYDIYNLLYDVNDQYYWNNNDGDLAGNKDVWENDTEVRVNGMLYIPVKIPMKKRSFHTPDIQFSKHRNTPYTVQEYSKNQNITYIIQDTIQISSNGELCTV